MAQRRVELPEFLRTDCRYILFAIKCPEPATPWLNDAGRAAEFLKTDRRWILFDIRVCSAKRDSATQALSGHFLLLTRRSSFRRKRPFSQSMLMTALATGNLEKRESPDDYNGNA
ncbi:MAG: hypothetical protein M1816_003942 [Peltula sp. TS41687]|nr:MAG: hypothetical protein M1816_003942 [Peltula sp. TS41687]